jgi:hypothetical protein
MNINEPHSTDRGARHPDRLLVVANETCGDPVVCHVVRDRAAPNAEVLVVAPSRPSAAGTWLSNDEKALADAQARLERTLDCLRKLGLAARGRIGDADPILAIEDALFDFSADEIVLLARPAEHAHWLRRSVIERAREKFGPRVSHVVVDDGEPAAALALSERAGR